MNKHFNRFGKKKKVVVSYDSSGELLVLKDKRDNSLFTSSDERLYNSYKTQDFLWVKYFLSDKTSVRFTAIKNTEIPKTILNCLFCFMNSASNVSNFISCSNIFITQWSL